MCVSVCVSVCVCVGGGGWQEGGECLWVTCVCVCANACFCICHSRDRKKIFLVSKDGNKILSLESSTSSCSIFLLPPLVFYPSSSPPSNFLPLLPLLLLLFFSLNLLPFPRAMPKCKELSMLSGCSRTDSQWLTCWQGRSDQKLEAQLLQKTKAGHHGIDDLKERGREKVAVDVPGDVGMV